MFKQEFKSHMVIWEENVEVLLKEEDLEVFKKKRLQTLFPNKFAFCDVDFI